MSRRSVMSHKFSEVPNVEIPRSSFDRSHGVKTTFDAGRLVPILVDEALPGDTFNVKMSAFARLATPIKPIMDNMFMETFFFAVPNRLVWDNWEKFNGQQDNPSDSTDYTIPVFDDVIGGIQAGTIHDHMGLPINVDLVNVSCLFHRAYALIWNEWFRDENLQDSISFSTGDAGGAISQFPFARRGKRHDYFTSALPWPQKGDPVTVPLGGTAPVNGIGIPTFDVGGLTNQRMEIDPLIVSNPTVYANALNDNTAVPVRGAPNPISWNGTGDPTSQTGASWNTTSLEADLSSATAITINALRQGFQTQRMFERDARGGTRYTEIIRSHFGVTSPDARLQRPEYLGGGSQMINIAPVAQQSPSDISPTLTPQGNLAAIGTASFNGHGFTKSFTEHSIIIGLVNVRADLTYQQGLNRMFSRRTRFDFFWPSLAHLGEQEILNKEIYTQGTAEDEDVFGYQERYAEYRYKPSEIHGKFRSASSTPLDVWHLSQDFESLPQLSPSFIEDQPPVERVIAVPSEPQFLFDGYFSMRCARPMPLYGVPGLIDHF